MPVGVSKNCILLLNIWKENLEMNFYLSMKASTELTRKITAQEKWDVARKKKNHACLVEGDQQSWPWYV